MRRIGALLLGVALVGAACSGDDDGAAPATTGGSTAAGTDVPVVDVDDLQFVSRLTTLGDCDAVLAHLREEAMSRVGPYGLDGYGGWYGPMGARAEELAVAGDAAGAPEANGSATGGEAVPATTMSSDEFSGTNTAEVGVDEADIVKTDGDRIYAVRSNELVIVDLTGAEPRRAGTVELDEQSWQGELLLAGDRVYVVSMGGGFAVPLAEVGLDRISPTYGATTTVIEEVDVSDPDAPTVTRTLTVDGAYVSVRVVDDVARIVVNATPSELPFVYPANEAAETRAEEVNRQVVAESTLEQWLPAYTLEVSGGETSGGLLLPCEQVEAPTEFAGFGTTAVLSLPLTDGLSDPTATSVGVLAPGTWVYASTENLYVATASYIPPEAFEEQDWDQRALDERYGTSIHRFAIAGTERAEYQASGTVPGHLLNDLSLSEYEGDLRVATTLGSPWSTESSESVITVLRPDGDALAVVGRVGGLGEGEQIFATRFVGTNAYVVTFRQTDPFYVVDLADPANPVVRGELKVPGYSGYLHQVGEGLVLGIGQEGTDDGTLTGMKASLFQVTDPSNPTELATWTYDGRGSSSAVEYDRKAFLWWEPLQIAVVPVNDWESGFFGVVLLRVTPEGITEVGRIDHRTEDLGEPQCPVLEGADADTVASYYGPGVVVQLCGPNDRTGIEGYDCSTTSAEELESILGETPAAVEQQGAVVDICWPPYQGSNPIERSVVIGDDLWTLSGGRLQANALDGLAEVAGFGF